VGFLHKMQTKIWLQANQRYRELTPENPAVREILAEYERTTDYDRFWLQTLELQRRLRESGGGINKEFMYARLVPDGQHPEIVRPLLGRGSYDPGLEVGAAAG
jgi:hypothetical protein